MTRLDSELLNRMGSQAYEAEVKDILARMEPEFAKKLKGASLPVLLRVERELANRKIEFTPEDLRRTEKLNLREQVIRILKEHTNPRGIRAEIPTGLNLVTDTLLKTKKVVSVLCPDFETRISGGQRLFVADGKLQEGIGLTGERFLTGLPLFNSLAEQIKGLKMTVLYHAVAEKSVVENNDSAEIVRRSAAEMRKRLQESKPGFAFQVDVIDDQNLFLKMQKETREISNKLNGVEIAKLNRDRLSIIMMRNKVSRWEVTAEMEKLEAAFDIASHELTEQHIQKRIGNNFVHAAVDSYRFARFYKQPVILFRGKFRYEGD